MQFLIDIKNIFYPNICLGCEAVLTINENILCTTCLFDLPLTNYLTTNDTSVEKIFFGRIKIEKATALLFYHKKGITQKIIHNLKYRGHEEIGVYLGNWLGKEIKQNKHFNTIDYIIPVPLHKKRLKSRGYNQVTKFGERLAFYLEKPFIENVLVRQSASLTQTKKSRVDRWKNVKELFFLNDETIFENKHVLIIDDIITTGATIESCANELFKTKNIKISVVVMAVTE